MTNKTTTESFLTSDQQNDNVDLGKVFRFMLMQSKLIISIVLVAFIISYANFFFSTKRYLIQSLLQFETFDQNIFDPSRALQMVSPSATSDIANIVELYESRTNYLKVINGLRLNIDVDNLKDNESVDINIVSTNNDPMENQKLKFSFSENSYALLDENLNEILTSKYGNQIVNDGLRIMINSAELSEYRPIDVHFRSPEGMYNSLKAKMDVVANTSRNTYFKNQGLVTISYVTDDIDLGKDIINYSNNVFLSQRISDESLKSRKAIDFIDQNIKSIEKSVEVNKNKLKEFREKINQ